MNEEKARKVYDSLRSGQYWLPMNCAIALRKAEVSYPYWVVLYNGKPEYNAELPKLKTESWYWGHYLTKIGLPKQDEFNDCKTVIKFWYNEQVALLLDFFISPYLEKSIFECLACHDKFDSYKDLMDHVVLGSHAEQFNAKIIEKFKNSGKIKSF